jgi:hypothetical protein
MKQLHRLPTDQELMDAIKHRRAIDYHYDIPNSSPGHCSFYPVNNSADFWVDWCICEQAPENDEKIFARIKKQFDNILWITVSIPERSTQSVPVTVYYNPEFFTENFDIKKRGTNHTSSSFSHMPKFWQQCTDTNLPEPDRLILMKLKGVDTNYGIRKGFYTNGVLPSPFYKFCGDGAWFDKNDIEYWMYIPKLP